MCWPSLSCTSIFWFFNPVICTKWRNDFWLLTYSFFVFLLFRLHELYKKLSIRIGIPILSPIWTPDPNIPLHQPHSLMGQPPRGTDNLIFFSLLIFLLFFSFLFFFVDVLYRLSLQEFLRDLSWDKEAVNKFFGRLHCRHWWDLNWIG